MPIDLAQVDWLYVIVLAMFVFLASLIGSLLAFTSRMTAAVLSALLFAAMFVAWTYYPHGLPLPTRLTDHDRQAAGAGAGRAGDARRRRRGRAIRSPTSRRRAIR